MNCLFTAFSGSDEWEFNALLGVFSTRIGSRWKCEHGKFN